MAIDVVAVSRLTRSSTTVVPPLTVCCWVRPDIVSGARTIWYQGTTSFSGMIFLLIDTNKFVLAGTNGSTICQTGTVLSTGTWYFVAASIDAAGNGAVRYRQEGTSTLTSVTGTGSVSGVSTNHMAWCADPTNTLSGFDGCITYGRLFASVLSEAQMLSESQSTTAVATEWADWTMLDAAGTLTDASGNSRPLTLGTGNTPTTAATSPTLGGAVNLGTVSANMAVTATVAGPAAGTLLNLSVVSGSDDGGESSGTVTLTSNSLLITSTQVNAVRYQNVTIAPGSVIELAAMTFVDSNTKHNDANMRASAHDVDNAPVLSTATNGISTLVKTTATADWVNIDLFTDTTTPRESTNFAAVVQEVIDRPGWQSGNALTMILDGLNSGNNLLAKSFEVGAAPSLRIIYTPAVALGTLTAGTKVGASVTLNQTHQITAKASTAVGARVSKSTTVAWDGDDLLSWGRDDINPDENPTGTVVTSTWNQSESGGRATFWLDPWDNGGGTRSYSNRRDWMVWGGTNTFKDGRIKVLFDPPRFTSGSAPTTYRPQHGIMARWVDNTDHHLGITIWHDITVPFPGVINFGVWRTERPLTGLTSQTNPPNTARRTTSNTGGFGMGQAFPYWIEAEFVGEKVRIRVWNDGDTPPAWDAASLTASRDLSEAATPGSGSTAYSRTPTPTQGAVGVMIGHISQLDMSAARIGAFTVEEYDALDVGQDIGAVSAGVAVDASVTLSVAREVVPESANFVGEASVSLAINTDLSLESANLSFDAAAQVDIDRVFVELVAEIVGEATVELDVGGPVVVPPSGPTTLTSVGARLTLTAIDAPARTLTATGTRLTLTAIED